MTRLQLQLLAVLTKLRNWLIEGISEELISYDQLQLEISMSRVFVEALELSFSNKKNPVGETGQRKLIQRIK